MRSARAPANRPKMRVVAACIDAAIPTASALCVLAKTAIGSATRVTWSPKIDTVYARQNQVKSLAVGRYSTTSMSFVTGGAGATAMAFLAMGRLRRRDGLGQRSPAGDRALDDV